MKDQDTFKRVAALHAVDEIQDHMAVGLGTGSTMAFVLEALAERVKDGLKIVAIPTSEKTAALGRHYNIPLTSFADHRQLDLTIDGADEVERQSLNLVKGAGGALFREKIVAAASARMIVVVDPSKLVDRLGSHMKLPVEIAAFGYEAILQRLDQAGMAPTLRMIAGTPFITDGGNVLADCATGPIADARALEAKLAAIVGVIESGLFCGLASKVIVGSESGASELTKT